jgi:hypothetical protein
MPELMSIRGNGPGLRVGCTFKASGPETASEDLCARAARLLSEGVEPIEIVLIDAERNHSGFLLPVGSDGKHHHLQNLWVADGSLFPSSIGVPPQLSIYAMGLHVGRSLAA